MMKMPQWLNGLIGGEELPPAKVPSAAPVAKTSPPNVPRPSGPSPTGSAVRPAPPGAHGVAPRNLSTAGGPNSPVSPTPKLPRQQANTVLTPVATGVPQPIGERTLADRLSAAPSLKGIRLHPEIVESEAQLGAVLQFSRALNNSLNLSPSIYSQIVAVEVVANSKRFALLASPGFVGGEEMVEVVKALLSRGIEPASGFNLIVCRTQPIIHAVATGALSGDLISRRQEITSNVANSAYWRAFVDIVYWAYRNDVSDIHFNVYDRLPFSQVMMTMDGLYVAPARFRLPTDMVLNMLNVAWQGQTGGKEGSFSKTMEQQCQIPLTLPSGQNVRLRFASIACDAGPQVTMRIVPQDAEASNWTLESLGYLPGQVAMFERIMRSEGGALLFAGVVNSGKSRSLGTLLRTLVPPTRKIVCVEDPAEENFGLPNIHQRTVSRDLRALGDAALAEYVPILRALKRSGLHGLMLQEIRDQETGGAMVDTVQSGLSVFSTVHAGNALLIPAKLASKSVGVSREFLATPGSLNLGCYQALISKVCPDCSTSATDWARDGSHGNVEKTRRANYIALIVSLYEIDPGTIRMRNFGGCSKCRREELSDLNGLFGRTLVAQMVEYDDQMLEFIRHDPPLNIEMLRYFASLRTAGAMDADMTGKDAMECAVYKMTLGQLDPRDIESRCEAFETVAQKRRREMMAVSRNKVGASGLRSALSSDRLRVESL